MTPYLEYIPANTTWTILFRLVTMKKHMLVKSVDLGVTIMRSQTLSKFSAIYQEVMARGISKSLILPKSLTQRISIHLSIIQHLTQSFGNIIG